MSEEIETEDQQPDEPETAESQMKAAGSESVAIADLSPDESVTAGPPATARAGAEDEPPPVQNVPAPNPTAPDATSATTATLEASAGPTDILAFLDRIGVTLARAGLGAMVQVRVLKQDADERGGVLTFDGPSLAEARTAASACINSGDGREWKYLNDGPQTMPNPDTGQPDLTGRFHCYVHVTPLG